MGLVSFVRVGAENGVGIHVVAIEKSVLERKVVFIIDDTGSPVVVAPADTY